MGTYVKLTEQESQKEKEKAFFDKKNYYQARQCRINKIPGRVWAYWISDVLLNDFEKGEILGRYATPKQGLITGNVNRFVRYWYECSKTNVAFAGEPHLKWYPYNSGGGYRKWYGNHENVVNWENEGYEIKNFIDEHGKLKSRPQGIQFYFKDSVSWSKISSGKCAFRYYGKEFIFSDAGMAIFGDENLKYLLGLLNSNVAYEILKMLSPTINVEAGDVKNMPVIIEHKNEVEEIVSDCIKEEEAEWDSFEQSWNFCKHPLI